MLQVWYSAAWSDTALRHFHDAVAAVVSTGRTLSGDVRRWLDAWSNARVPLPTSRREWLKRQVKSSSGIANALSCRDQHELCSYRLTGQLLDASTGSVAMCVVPQNLEKPVDHTDEEHILDTIPPEVLMAAYRGLDAAERTLLGAGIGVARRRVHALKAALAEGRLSLQV